MAVEVEVSHFAAVPAAVVRRQARPGELSRIVPEACGTVWNFVRASGFKRAGRNIAIYWDGAITVEAGVEVEPPFEGAGEVVLSATPEGIAAHAVHIGSYAELGRAHEAIHQWSRATRRAFAGPSWEIYGHWTDDVTRLRTDVYYLVAP